MGNHGAVWHYGESVRNLKGTARTLDQADGGVVLRKTITYNNQEGNYL